VAREVKNTSHMRSEKLLEKLLLVLALAGCAAIPFVFAGCGDDSGGHLDFSSIPDASAVQHDLSTPPDLTPPNGDLGEQD
jgi:hypothetical protein